MADQNLTVKINAETGGAPAAIASVEERLAALERAYIASAGAAKAQGEATAVAAAGSVKAAEASEGLAGALRQVETHSIIAARGLQVLGLDAEAGAVKVGALAEVLEGIGKAAGPLLLVGAAIGVVAAGLGFLKDAVKEAAETEVQMRRLQTAVENSGKAWEPAREQIEQFVNSESRLAGFSMGELRGALNRVVEAGHDVADAMTIVAVSEDAARATGRGLEEVTQAVIAAETGRLRGLIAIDPRLKEFIKDHHDMDSILTKLAQDMRDQAINSTDTYAVAVGRLNSAWTSFKEDVGSWLLPWLADVANEVTNLVDQIHLFTAALGHLAGGSGAQQKERLLNAATHHHITDAELTRRLADVDKQETKAWEVVADPLSAANAHEKQMHDQGVARHRALASGIHLGHNTTGIGEKKGASSGGSGSGTSFSYTPFEMPKDASKGNDEVAERQKLYDSLIASTTDLAEKQKLLARAYDEAAVAAAADDATVTMAKEALAAAGAEENRYNEAIRKRTNAGVAETDAEKNHAAELHDRVKKITGVLNEATKARGEHRAIVERDSAALGANTAAITAQAAAAQKLRDDDAKRNGDLVSDAYGSYKMGVEAERKYWQDKLNAAIAGGNAMNADYIKASDHLAQIELRGIQQRRELQVLGIESRDHVATYGDSLAQEIAYYSRRLAALKQFGEEYEGQEFEIQKKIGALEFDEFKQRADAHAAFLKTWQDRESSALQGILTGKTSLRDGFKALWNDVFDDMAKAMSDKLVHGSLFKSMNDQLAKLFGITDPVGATQGDAAAAKALQTVQLRTTAEDRATQATTGATSALGSFTAALDRASASVGHGGGGGSGAGSIFDTLFSGGSSAGGSGGADGKAGFDPFALLTGGGSDYLGGTKDINIDSIGGQAVGKDGALPTNISKINGSSMAAGAMSGLMIGQMIAGLDGGNATWGGVGGAIGGAFFGPAGAAVGGFLGSLLGNHSLGPSKQPDIYNPEWGQADVDFNGAAGAQTFNGKSYTAAAQYNVGMGGTPMYKLMEQWANAAVATTDAQKALQAQIKALEGGNPNADFGVVREANNIAYLANGQQISVPDLIALEKSYTSQVGTGPASSSLWQLTRTYPDFAGTLSPNGTYTPTPINQNGGGTTGGSGTGSGSGGGTTGGGGGQRSVNIPGPPGDLTVQLVMPNGDALASAVFPGVMRLAGRQTSGLVAGRVRAVARM